MLGDVMVVAAIMITVYASKVPMYSFLWVLLLIVLSLDCLASDSAYCLPRTMIPTSNKARQQGKACLCYEYYRGKFFSLHVPCSCCSITVYLYSGRQTVV